MCNAQLLKEFAHQAIKPALISLQLAPGLLPQPAQEDMVGALCNKNTTLRVANDRSNDMDAAHGLLPRHVLGKHIPLIIVAGNFVPFGGPGTQVDQTAAGGAEWAFGGACVPADRRLAGRTFNNTGHAWPP